MITLLRLFGEFFFIGAFSVGGGMATIPFLSALSERSAWFSLSELTSIIAISEATPGPIGVNMATYVGYTVAGVPGAIIASIALTLPAFLVIFLLAKLIERYRAHPRFSGLFKALRPASIGLIGAVLLRLCSDSFLLSGDAFALNPVAIALFVVISLGLLLPKLSKIPIPVYLLLAAGCGIVFRM